MTVSEVALRAGIDGAERYIDASTLHSDKDIYEAAARYVVFGRVSPDRSGLSWVHCRDRVTLWR